MSKVDSNYDICYSFPKKRTNNGTESHRMKYVYESIENIDRSLQEKVRDLDMKLQIGEDKCTYLLLRYDWNENKLLGDLSSFSPAELKLKVGIKIHARRTESKVPLLQPARSRYTCMICCSEADDPVKSVSNPNEYMHTFHTSLCNHLYCTDCYCHYIQEKNLNRIVVMKCPEPECEFVLSLSDIKTLSDFNEGKINRAEARLRESREAKDGDISKRFAGAEIVKNCSGFKDGPDGDDGHLYSDEFCGESGNKYQVNQLFKFEEREGEKAKNEQKDILRESIYLRYKRNIQLLYRERNLRKTRYCPIPGCENLVKVVGFDSNQIDSLEEFTRRLYIPSVECKSGHKFCFQCSEEDHTPCPCELAAQLKRKYREDCESAEWIYRYTKACPQCKSAIQKNGGCRHMFCTECSYQFCWQCKKSIYDCTVCFSTGSIEGERSENLFHRYSPHVELYGKQSILLKKDRKFYDDLEMKIQRIQQKYNVSSIKIQFYRNCIDILVQCKLALVWSNATLPYVKTSRTRSLMEKNTNLLSDGIERLSNLFKNTPMSRIMRTKRNFLNAADSVDNLRLHLNEVYLDVLPPNLLLVGQPTRINYKRD